MQIINDVDWKAQWIWNGGEESPRNAWHCFRKTFTLSEKVDSAILHLTADSRYVLYVNGYRVGRGPVRSWPNEQFFDTYEIGHLFQPHSTNTIAVQVMHYGVSTFSYVRGQGGLLAQLELSIGGACIQVIGTDHSWLTSAHGGQEERSPRMSIQLAFSELADARSGSGTWIKPHYDDSKWKNAHVVGSVGIAPWTSLKPRDIPLLTEEIVYPSRVESLRKVKPVTWTAVVDIRNQMIPGGADHANPLWFNGYIATVIEAQQAGKAVFGFPNGSAPLHCSLNGLALDSSWYGVEPERYIEVNLIAGDNLLLMDITGREHGNGLRVGLDTDVVFNLKAPIEQKQNELESSPFISIGPFHQVEEIDFQAYEVLNMDQEEYVQVGHMASASDLHAYAAWIRPVPRELVSCTDVFANSVWKRESIALSVTASIHNAVIANALPALIPAYDGYDTEFIVDFGKEVSGYVSFDVEAPEGAVIDLYGFEYLRDGYIQHTYGLDNTLRYICEQGRQQYTSFVRRGFRYLMVTIRKGSIEGVVKIYEITTTQSNYPVAEVGQFHCSDALLNDIWQISRHTTKLCMEDTFVDCPAYEQAYWVGDSRNEALVNYYVYGATDIVERCLNLVPGSRSQTPLYADQVPSGWSSVIPNWTFFWVIACKEYYEHTGDREFAERIWHDVKYTLQHYLLNIDERGLLYMKGWNLLDWAPMDQPNDGVVTHQNMFLVKALQEGASLSSIAGDEETEISFLAAAEQLKDAINLYLWSTEKQAYIDCIHANGQRSDIWSMQTQVTGFLCDIAQGERKLQLEQYMEQPPIEFVQIGSPFMSFFYYEALATMGRFDHMVEDIRTNYGHMIEYGATTCWEMYGNSGINRANPNMLSRSHCHAWSAAPGYFLSAYVLGIQSAATGWKEVTIEPQLCGLSWARGTVPLPDGGSISVYWKQNEIARRIHIRVEAPNTIKLSIKLPDGYEGEIEQILVS